MITSASEYPITFTILWLAFAILWAGKSLVLRRGREYAKNRKFVDKNVRFKYVSYFVYLCQLVIVIPTFWSDSKLLLKFYDSDQLRLVGIALSFTGLILYLYAQKHLGSNYSPCFDSHEPLSLISTGPYGSIRHPGWLSKVLTGVGTILLSGSLWFLPMMIWLVVEMRRTIRVEERYLCESFAEYVGYKSRTWALMPYFY